MIQSKVTLVSILSWFIKGNTFQCEKDRDEEQHGDVEEMGNEEKWRWRVNEE